MNALKLFDLAGRTAIVTGGGRGLGEYMARALADAGASVLVCSRKLDALESVCEDIRADGGTAVATVCDVSRPEDAARAVEQAVDQFGSIDILVNNSGTTWGAPPEEMPTDKFDRVMEVNVRGTFLMSQAAARSMIDQGRGGRIINIASILGLRGGRPGLLEAAGYSASKGAVLALTRDLAGSWARHGITVNAIAPGWFPTRMSSGVLDAVGEEMKSAIPLGRFGSPQDIQGAVLYLASEAGGFVTGQTLIVDGGQTVW